MQHKLAGIDPDSEMRLYNGKCACGWQTGFVAKPDAYSGLVEHFTSTPEFNAMVSRRESNAQTKSQTGARNTEANPRQGEGQPN